VFSDTSRPEFKTCPTVPNVNVDSGQTKAVVKWDVPVVDDNVDKAIKPKLTKGLAPGSRFPMGQHHIEYTAQDTAKNTASPCRFSFTVGSG